MRRQTLFNTFQKKSLFRAKLFPNFRSIISHLYQCISLPKPLLSVFFNSRNFAGYDFNAQNKRKSNEPNSAGAPQRSPRSLVEREPCQTFFPSPVEAYCGVFEWQHPRVVSLAWPPAESFGSYGFGRA